MKNFSECEDIYGWDDIAWWCCGYSLMVVYSLKKQCTAHNLYTGNSLMDRLHISLMMNQIQENREIGRWWVKKERQVLFYIQLVQVG